MKNKRILSWALAACLVVATAMPALAADVEFADMPEDWSTEALENAVDNGLLTGFNENGKYLIKAKSSLTRAQMAAIINNAFNTSAKGSLSGVSDVNSGDWFYDHMGMAVQMNSFAKAEKMRPNDKITREEAFTVLAKVFKLPDGNNSALNTFSDANNISDWAKSRVAALAESGYISGAGGKLNPKSNITRAEFATVMNNIVAQYISEPGEVSEVEEGNILINVSGVTLKDVTVDGDLIVADGVGTGEVVLDSVKVTGTLVVRGGGVNSIKITGTSEITAVVVDNVNNEVRIYTADGVKVQQMDASGKVILEGTFGDVSVVGEGATIQVNGNVETLTLDASADNAEIKVTGNASVGNVINESSGNVALQGNFDKVTITAADGNVEIKGTIKELVIAASATDANVVVPAGSAVAKLDNQAEGTTLDNKGTITQLTGNDVNVPPAVTTPPPSGGGGSSGGGGGGNTGSLTITMNNVAGIATKSGVNFEILEGYLTDSSINVTIKGSNLSGTATLTVKNGNQTKVSFTAPSTALNTTYNINLSQLVGLLDSKKTSGDTSSISDANGGVEYTIIVSAGNFNGATYYLKVVAAP